MHQCLRAFFYAQLPLYPASRLSGVGVWTCHSSTLSFASSYGNLLVSLGSLYYSMTHFWPWNKPKSSTNLDSWYKVFVMICCGSSPQKIWNSMECFLFVNNTSHYWISNYLEIPLKPSMMNRNNCFFEAFVFGIMYTHIFAHQTAIYSAFTEVAAVPDDWSHAFH